MISIIVCSHRPNRAAFARQHYASLFSEHEIEFILIDDARSLCEGYNRGITRSSGDVVVLSHDDVEFVLPDAAERIVSHLHDFDLIGIAGTTKVIDGGWYMAGDPYSYALVIQPDGDGYEVQLIGSGPLTIPGVQALDGCFMACRREVAVAIGFDSYAFDGFHLYDIDFSYRAAMSGYALAVCRDLPLIHLSPGGFKDSTWEMYRRRFQAKHRATLPPDAQGKTMHIVVRADRQSLPAICNPSSISAAIKHFDQV